MNNFFDIDEILQPHQSVALIAHDAGAATHIASWFSGTRKDLNIYAEGPAKSIFEKVLEQETQESLDSVVNKSTLVITGTGWASDLEHRARELAMNQNKPSAAVLDHWVNYRERFEHEGSISLPGELWVADPEAAAIASSLFPMVPVRLLPNCWLERLKRKVQTIRINRNRYPQRHKPAKRLLYLLEPIRTRWIHVPNNNSEAGEIQALRYWLQELPKLIDEGFVAPAHQLETLTLRTHPSEPYGKYDSFISEYSTKWPIMLDTSTDLEESLASTDAAFGCETQALVAAMACNIPAYSTLPPWAPPCRLPHALLKHLSKRI